jgi:hypothetical protein
VAIGVKPARLLERSDRSIGARMFVEESDAAVKVRQVTCHELVHACSAHLRLPAWLNEGIAVMTVDRFAGRPTIREETLGLMRDRSPGTLPPTYRELSRLDGAAIAYHNVRGYWLVRYLEAEHPGFLMRMLSQRRHPKAIEREVAAELGIGPADFWVEIDGVLVGYFAPAPADGGTAAPASP